MYRDFEPQINKQIILESPTQSLDAWPVFDFEAIQNDKHIPKLLVSYAYTRGGGVSL